jgi:hypothetical protein
VLGVLVSLRLPRRVVGQTDHRTEAIPVTRPPA